MNYDTLAEDQVIDATIAGLAERNFIGTVVATGAEALEEIKKLIPKGASVMNGASTTLNQIGFVDYLKAGAHGWNNLHEGILAEKDTAKQAELRKLALSSDFYLGSVHAMTSGGEMVIASNTGSQLPHLVFTSQNIILVVSTKKITPNLSAAMDRLDTHVVPLEDVRAQKAYGSGTMHTKTLILHKENPYMGRKVHVILVRENLGF